MNMLSSGAKNKYIKVNYFLNDQESTLSFLSSKSVGDLKKIIELSLNININKYDIFYRSNKIDDGNDNLPIQVILGKDIHPILFIKLKIVTDNKRTKASNFNVLLLIIIN